MKSFTFALRLLPHVARRPHASTALRTPVVTLLGRARTALLLAICLSLVMVVPAQAVRAALFPPGVPLPGARPASRLPQALAATTTALVSSRDPVLAGATVTFTTTVSAPGATPTGDVVFAIDGSALPAVALVAGRASYSTTWPAAGTHRIVASYGGSGGFQASHSEILWQSVAPVTCSGSDFGTAVNYAAGASPVAVASADFDGNGAPDLAVANSGSNDISILLRRDPYEGGFAAATTVAVGTNPQALAAGDFDEDGAPDLAVANYGSNNVSILLGDGDGGLGPAQDYNVGFSPQAVVSGDLDGDGALDLVVANSGSNNISVLLGDGSGGFANPANLSVGSSPVALALGDFNGDHDIDVAIARRSAGVIAVRQGDGQGGFGAATDLVVGTNPQSVIAEDFDGDGFVDLAAANSGSNNVSILLGDGSGGFAPATTIAVKSSPQALAAGDFDDDGAPDLAVANYGSNNISILLGDGAGSFSMDGNYVAGLNPQWPVAGDFDGDGLADLAVANKGSNDVSILAGDGRGSFAAAATYDVENRPQALAIGDLNDDGVPDLAVAKYYGFDFVSQLLGLGSGRFEAASNYQASSWTHALVLGDFNADEVPDLALATGLTGDTNHISVLLGLGGSEGGFGPPSSYNVGYYTTGIVAADFDRDGVLDLAAVSNDSVAVLLGHGDGTFAAAVRYALADSGGSYLVSGDFNGDGILDLAVSYYYTRLITLLFGDGSGGFGAPVSYTIRAAAWSLASADLNGDGNLDLVVANQYDGTGGQSPNGVSVLAGNGQGGFASPAFYSLEGEAHFVSLDDLNADGRIDIAVAMTDSNSVSVLLGDGTGSFAAPVSFAQGSSANGIAAGDLNDDGRLDLVTTNPDLNQVTVFLNTCRAATTTGLTSSANPVRFGQTLFLTATLSISDPAGVAPSGEMHFSIDGSRVARPLVDGQATYSADTLLAGAHTITTDYGGDGGFNPSVSAPLAQVVQAATVTSLSAAPASVVYGQTVFLTATVGSPGGAPSGTVDFFGDGASLGSAALAGDSATLLVDSLPAGTHSITATYSGVTGFDPSTSPAWDQTVSPAPTATSLVSSEATGLFGHAITFTATVSSAAGAPTGDVTFYADGSLLGIGLLAAGRAVLTTATLPAGSHAITASYPGGGNFGPSTALAFTQSVDPASTTTTLEASVNPSLYGQAVDFTATVSSSGGTPGGTVTVYDGSAELGTAILVDGRAAIGTSTLAAGAHAITAVYAGAANFSASSAPVLMQVVRANTQTTLRSSVNPSELGQTVTFTATVSSPAGTPTGSVDFYDGSTLLGSGALVDGCAAWSSAGLPTGTHSITATYAGSIWFNPSTTPALLQSVSKAGTATSLATAGPASYFGQPLVFTATVTSPAGTPGGSVTFYADGVLLGSRPLAAGRAVYAGAVLAAGHHSITATYIGAASFKPSTAPAVSAVVDKASSNIVLAASPNPAPAGATVTFTAAVISAAGEVTGTVTFSNGEIVLGTVALTGGRAALSRAFEVGTHSIKAAYSGNANIAPSLAEPLFLIVQQGEAYTYLPLALR